MRKLRNNELKVGVIGLGYVGLPLALQLDRYFCTVGYDINNEKINQLLLGKSPIDDIRDSEICNSKILFTRELSDIKECNIYIIAVPTPIDSFNRPDLSPLEVASEIVGKVLSVEDVVIYESTVYPGVTEEICIPILEKSSKMKLNNDFGVGYSPERVNPGDAEHPIDKIYKIISSSSEKYLDIIRCVYSSFLDDKIYYAPTIKIAEAAKILENTQRDVNIALVNEFSIVCHELQIDFKEVLSAAKTKWNFLDFQPGFVGGHCIGVDPYYMIHKSQQLGISPEVMLASRKINNNYPNYIDNKIVKKILELELDIKKINVGILGIAFKENCSDIRNSKIIDLVQNIRKSGIFPKIYDPLVSSRELLDKYNLKLTKNILNNLDVMIVAVPHKEFYSKDMLIRMFRANQTPKILFDLKGAFEKDDFEKQNIIYWRP